MVLSIIDIETTGGSNGNFVTEFACFQLINGEIRDNFSSLVKPPVAIPPFIQKLTGITHEMVQDAPTFEEIAPQIFDFIKGTTFVAHNVAFDYGVLKSAFARANITFNQDRLCSIQLARKVFPKERSYSLGKLCRSLKIPLENRHRAYGDALATAKLMKKIIENDSGILEKNLQPIKKHVSIPSHLDPKEFEDLPNQPGIYYFLNEQFKPVYIGKAKNIKNRVRQHFSENSAKKAELKRNIYHLDHQLTGNELLAELIESAEIKKYWPTYNKIQKYTSYAYCIFQYCNQSGAIRLGIEKNSVIKNPLISFSNVAECYRFLHSLSKEFGLCQKFISGKSNAGDCVVCKDNGYVCPTSKKFEDHNKRMLLAISSFLPHNGNFLITESGKTTEEVAFIWVKNWIYMGYAFVPKGLSITKVEDLEAHLHLQSNNNDVQRILKKYLRRKAFPKLISLK